MFPSCLIFTLITIIYDTFMFRFNVILKMMKFFCLKLALSARISETFVFRICVMGLCCCLMFKLVARISNTFVFRFHVRLKISLLCCLKITLVTEIFDTFMFGLYVLMQTLLQNSDNCTTAY
jgi:hypothetical protein